MKKPFLILLSVLAVLCLLQPAVFARLPHDSRSDLNALILHQIRTMPEGGGYAITSEATRNLRGAVALRGGQLRVTPGFACPSYCSGATYLVFLKTVEALQRRGALALSPETLAALTIQGQPDGVGVWGRWNANGPGTARLFYELGLGRNFDDYEEARPGDFMKIFWSREVGKTERGHSVIYLGREMINGVEHVRFWSSNKPAGYGEKTVPRSRIAYAIFSRLEHPENLARVSSLPRTDRYLASLLKVRSSIPEAREKSGF